MISCSIRCKRIKQTYTSAIMVTELTIGIGAKTINIKN
jgi:hypothetical protein